MNERQGKMRIMEKSKQNKGFSFERPGNYRICIKGILDRTWWDCLGGLHIVKTDDVGKFPVTTLQGQVADQSELSGILNTFCQLGMTILSVRYLNND